MNSMKLVIRSIKMQNVLYTMIMSFSFKKMIQLIQFVTLQKRILVQLELNWISPGAKTLLL